MTETRLDEPHDSSIAARRATLTTRYGDGSDGSAPTLEQWRRLFEGPIDLPVTLINFFKLRSTACYPEGDRSLDPATSGGEAMLRYAAVSAPALEKVGGHFLLTAPFEASLMGVEVNWDMVAIGTYPSREALFALFEDEAYSQAYVHRRAAIERQHVLVVRG